jgi:WD40 repeat protein
MSCNPYDQTTNICITGENIFRIFRFQEGFLKLIYQTKFEQDLTCHTWVSENRVLCGTSDTKLLVFEQGELISEMQYLVPLNNDAIDDHLKQPVVTAISAFSNGVLLGLENGCVVYFEKTPDVPYKQKKEVFFEEGGITNIQWNGREDRAVISTALCQIFLLNIENNAEVHIF